MHRLAQRPKDLLRMFLRSHALRMPLHSQKKPLSRQLQALNRAVVCARGRLQPLTQPLHRLMVRAVYQNAFGL